MDPLIATLAHVRFVGRKFDSSWSWQIGRLTRVGCTSFALVGVFTVCALCQKGLRMPNLSSLQELATAVDSDWPHSVCESGETTTRVKPDQGWGKSNVNFYHTLTERNSCRFFLSLSLWCSVLLGVVFIAGRWNDCNRRTTGCKLRCGHFGLWGRDSSGGCRRQKDFQMLKADLAWFRCLRQTWPVQMLTADLAWFRCWRQTWSVQMLKADLAWFKCSRQTWPGSDAQGRLGLFKCSRQTWPGSDAQGRLGLFKCSRQTRPGSDAQDRLGLFKSFNALNDPGATSSIKSTYKSSVREAHD